jgi:cytochrome c-type biogenesis protein CcmH/NrfF
MLGANLVLFVLPVAIVLLAVLLYFQTRSKDRES